MNYQGNLYGFRVTRERYIEEIGANMVEMVYEKTKTPLVYLERADTNKSFAITFKTIPEDDTGVFHILEHSVLCGSKKYPVKEPFVELLKGSMQTFLNAMTFNDKTMYPVSSRNGKDFLNLIDVYMDAVLHPAILENKNIFLQEGWHYELETQGAVPTYKGVVFNEMKGAYSSPDELAEEELTKLLYPDTPYGKDSGGNPTVIPTLTYEHFLDCHKRFYHPSNARFFLDGEMDLGAVLQKLDGFLSEYSYREVDASIPYQSPLPYREKTVPYEIAEDEDEENKVRLYLGYMGFPYDAQKELIALSVIGNVLAGSNDAPINRALLSENLCEDVEISQLDGIMQTSVSIDVRNTETDKIERIKEVIQSVLQDTVKNGLDRDRTVATLNSMEFSMRERDFGSTPKGLVYAIASLDSWLYGGDPKQNLCYNETLAFLRENLDTGYLEDLIRRVFLQNPHTVSLTLCPSKTLANDRLAEENRRLTEAKEHWSVEETKSVFEQNQRLISWQSKEDSPEALATLPSLSVSDIDKEPEKIPAERMDLDGKTLLYHDIPTEGIYYTDLWFSADDTATDDLCELKLLSGLLTNLGTKSHDPLTLQNEIKKWLGGFNVYTDVVTRTGVRDKANLYLHVAVSCLEVNRDKVGDLVREILTQTEWHDAERIRTVLRQMKSAKERFFTNSGHSFGRARISAALTTGGAVSELLGGYDAYIKIKKLEKNFDREYETLANKLQRLADTMFVKERIALIAHTGKLDREYLSGVVGVFPDGEPCTSACLKTPPFGISREGLEIPSQIAYATVGGYLPAFTGTAAVAENLVSYEYLWNAVRVKGGAYGCGMIARHGGAVFFYSYRDPDAKRTLGAYRGTGDFLREFLSGDVSIDKYIIGAVAASEPLRTPYSAADTSNARYLCGVSDEDMKNIRLQMLSTTKADLLALADAIEEIAKSGPVFVTGGKDKLTAVDELDRILKI